MDIGKMEYTAVIRTLGTAGDKYQRLLMSLDSQLHRPKEIIVYIAEGYPIPKESVGWERYIYVKKGMLAQRALSYDEVNTEYILFLDDDLEFPSDTVSRMFELLNENHADVISPDIFPNSERSFGSELMMTLSGRMRARRNDDVWGYKVMPNAGYSYNKNPEKEVYESQTNAGACYLCRKEDFLKIDLQDEAWLDSMAYALGDDQVMYYKMYCRGLKQLTWYRHNFVHLDAGNNMTPEKERMRLYGDLYFKTVFWHRFIYKTRGKYISRLYSCLSVGYAFMFSLLISLLKLRFDILKTKCSAIKDGISFLRSEEYKSLPSV